MALIKKTGKPSFKYQERTAEDMEQRQKSFSGRDSYFSKNMKFFVTKGGGNKIRIMPPTWEGAKHYGHDIYVHYGIGPDNVGYLCLDRMSGEPCPLCEARAEADHTGDEDLAKALRATRRVAVYVIDRSAPGEGPKVWAMPQTVDKEICAQAWDKETGEVYALDHPDEGYDISFDVEGQGQTKKYVGIRLARRSSPLSDDDKQAMAWLQHVTDFPIPNELVLHEYDEMKQAFEGQPSAAAEKDQDSRAAPSEKKRPIVGKKPKVEEPAEEEGEEEPEKEAAPTPAKTRPKIGGAVKVAKKKAAAATWEEVHQMDEDGIGEFATEHAVEFPEEEFASLEECQDFVCAALDIEPEAAEEEAEEAQAAPPKKSSNLADRLRGLKKK